MMIGKLLIASGGAKGNSYLEALLRLRPVFWQVAVASTDLPSPQPDIVTRPWPRSVLPHYASGGLAVGFGEHARGATAYNPFQSQADIGNLPPLANVEAPQDTQATGADTQREQQP